MTTTEHLRRQRGVALLFALGLLSLMLVMGVAFLGNALIARKMAVNTNESASARQLGRSVVDRALAHLTLLALAQNSQAAGMYASDAGSVFSRLSADAFNGKADFTANEAGRIFRDGIYTQNAAESLLPLTPKSDTADGLPRSQAEWIYLHKNGLESNGLSDTQTANPIIARYAYQFLPQSSPSRLSLFAVTSGSRKGGIEYAVKAGTAITRRPQLYRWGVEVDELIIPELNNMFSTYWKYQLESGAPADSLCAPAYEFNNFIGILSGDKSPNPFFGGSDAVNNKKNWLKSIFAEGRGRISREAYFDGDKFWYPRFNLGEASGTDVWYSRFLTAAEARADDSGASVIDTLKNANVLNRLARKPETGDVYTDGNVEDSDYANYIGLPFLKALGSSSEKRSFPDMESFRKQIAANLNDYCDSDSIPTSNVAPGTWGGLVGETDGDKLPAYTGNEKTLYINEVAFGFKLHKSKLEADGGKCVFSPFISSHDTKKNKMRAEIIVELIELYKGLPETYKNMRLEGRLNKLTLRIKAHIKGKVTIHKADDPPEKTEKIDLGEDGIEVTKEASLTTPKDFTIRKYGEGIDPSYDQKFGFRRSGAYWVGRCDLNQDTNPCSIDFTAKIKEKAGTDQEITVTSIDEVSHIKVEILGVSFNLGNLALYLKDKDSSPTVDNFVDFVRVTPGERATAPDSPLNIFASPGGAGDADGWLEKSKLASETASASGKSFFYGGSMQVYDPRQNLFAALENTADNDWYTTFAPSLGDASGTPNWDTLDNRKVGAKNECSDPSAPKYVDGTPRTEGTYDTETATDPAWRGDGVVSEELQHISTAVIRNKPMRSPWELGFIHRAAPFQTINLKKAGGIDDTGTLAEDAHHPDNFDWTDAKGTKYVNGDAGILDQIKMTEYNKSYGKVDMSTLRDTANPDWWTGAGSITELNKQIFVSLFTGIRTQQPLQFLAESDDPKTPPAGDELTPLKGTDFSTAAAEGVNLGNIPETSLRSKVLNGLQTAFIPADSGTVLKNDAEKEEIIGKTINLIEGKSCSFPNVFRVMVVVQTIRDLDGVVSRVGSAPYTAVTGKFDAAIKGKSDDAVYADPDSSIYYDEILSECRMLATIERITYMEGNNPRVKFRVRQIEYLD